MEKTNYNVKISGKNNAAKDLNLAKRLALIYGRVVLTAALIFAALITILMVKQYYDKKNHMIKTATDDLEERAISVDYFLSNAAEDVIESKIWAENYLDMSRNRPGLSESIRPLRLDSDGSILIEPPSNKDMYGNIVAFSSMDAADPDTVRQIDMAFKLFEVQRINHYAPPDFTWSEFYSTKGFGSVYPWNETDKSMKILERRIAKEMLHRLATDAGKERSRNSFESNVWSEVYVDVSGRGLMITCGSPVFDGEEFIGMVSAEMGMDFFSHYVEKPETANATVMIINSKGQILASTGMMPENMERISMVEESFKTIAQDSFFLDKETTQNTGYLHSGRNHIITTRLSKADWVMIKIVPEADIMRAFFPEALFGALVVGLMFGFLIAANRVINRYFVSPTLGFIEFIETEATTGPAQRPNVPTAWEKWFIRISDTLALKSVAANLPGAVFQMKKNMGGKPVLTVLSSGVEQLIGMPVEKLVNRDSFLLDFMTPDQASSFIQLIIDSENNLNPFAFETNVKTQSGDERWVRFILRPRKEAGEGKETVWDGLMLDISDRKRLEDELRQHRDQLEETVASRTGELKQVNEELRKEISERIRSETALKISEERIRAMSQQVIQSQDTERERLSRELHDEIGQQIAAVLFQMPVIRNKSHIAPEEILRIEGMIRDIGEDLHRICKGLQPMTLTQFGLGPALKMLLWEFMEIYQRKITTAIESLDYCVNNELAAAVYRICQEAVSNSIRHSDAEEISVSLKRDRNEITLEIRDNGNGFDMNTAQETGKLGISGMRHRAGQCGGNLSIETTPGKGTGVVFTYRIQNNGRNGK